jgi:thiamine-phosphate diphosphorylase
MRPALDDARVLLIFSPELCGERPPLDVLESVLPWVDLIQVRPKPLGQPADAPSQARECMDWTARVLERIAASSSHPPVLVPVLVNDRVDVAAALKDRGCRGVHLGQDDAPPGVARAVLGGNACIGLSTHGERELELARAQPIDYVGLGPVFPSSTRGCERGLGARACCELASKSALPLFPIGGITAENVSELRSIGRAAVGAGILAAPDPPAAARLLRERLLSLTDGTGGTSRRRS